nr:11K [Jasmine virus C]
MRYELEVALVINRVFQARGVHNLALALYISKKAVGPCLNNGRSTYARRRRARSISRCYRCYRVYPPLSGNTRCNGRTCFPGINYRVDVEEYIKFGVAAAIPNFEL